jgi:hypothetical protein
VDSHQPEKNHIGEQDRAHGIKEMKKYYFVVSDEVADHGRREAKPDKGKKGITDYSENLFHRPLAIHKRRRRPIGDGDDAHRESDESDNEKYIKIAGFIIVHQKVVAVKRDDVRDNHHHEVKPRDVAFSRLFPFEPVKPLDRVRDEIKRMDE